MPQPHVIPKRRSSSLSASTTSAMDNREYGSAESYDDADDYGDDEQTQEDGYPPDDVYDPRTRSSVVRYQAIEPATATTRMRAVRHQGAAPTLRASRSAPSTTTEPEPTAPRQQRPPLALAAPRQRHHGSTRFRLHGLTYLAVGMVLALLLLVLGSVGWQWWQDTRETWQYGTPRTYQTDANVGHGGSSHFTIENLQGHVIITEIHLDHVAASKVYQGPMLAGAGSDQYPATVRFADVNGDHLPDMIITMDSVQYVFLNANGGFRPATPADKITGVLP